MLLELGAQHVLVSPARVVAEPCDPEQLQFAEALRAAIHATRCR